MGLVGSAVFQAIVHRRVSSQFPRALNHLLRPARAAAFLAALFLGLSQLLKLGGQISAFADPEPVTREIFNLVLFESSWGHNWQIQSAAVLLVIILIPLVRTTWALLPMALAIVLVAPLTGHAIEHPWGPNTGLALHAVHQLGGGMWLGTLALVIGVGYGGTRSFVPAERHRLIAEIVHGYSPIALVGVGTAILVGLVLSYSYLHSIPAIWATGYGRALLVKTLFLGGTAAIGAYNWRRVRPALGEDVASERLYRSATVELILGALLLGATAVLVALEAPGLG
jgi:putative copper export protein